ncbi:MAG: hypothetical protein C5B57_01185 [Blastocatellia bacterium]|nr:MAG: hypothetical protein C5B57_01185 [Blastocatellia bacterium]
MNASTASSWRRTLTSEISRISGLAAAIVAISVVHSATAQSPLISRELLLRLYYLPILVGAYWYGAPGGLLVALASSVAYVPHVWETTRRLEAGRYAEVVVFHLIGITVGLLATGQRRIADRYQRAAATLERANRELRDSYEQLQRVDRLKTLGEVAAGLAHEIRHPLASIRGALEIIAEHSRSDGPQAEFSRLAMLEVERLDNLVWEFLRYARPHKPNLQPTSLREVVERVGAVLGVEAERAAVTLQLVPCEAMPDLFVDALQIEQVLLNVTLNAIQASPPKSCVRVCQHVEEGYALIDVIDEGPGISAEDQARLFSPFFTTKEKGTGLGLAIAHRIVRAHRGQIEVQESSPSGTCVRIRLPIQRSNRPAESSQSSQATT